VADALTREEVEALIKGMADGHVGTKPGAPARDGAQPVSLIAERQDAPRRFPALALVNERLVRELGRVFAMMFEGGVYVERRDPFALDFDTLRNRLVPRSMLGIFTVAPLAGEGLVMLPPALGFEMVDRLFGGPGRVPHDVGDRELSPIALRTVEGIATQVLDAFAAAWAPLVPVECRLVRSESNPMLVEIASNDETVLGFEAVCDLGGGPSAIWIVLPQTALESARARLEEAKVAVRRPDRAWLGALHGAIEQTEVVVSADLGRLELSAREVLGMRAGDVLHLPTRGEDPLSICVEGRPLLSGLAGVSRGRNAVRVVGFHVAEGELGG